jgi:branched-subunit amino acid aminotransferase/4-amino-4-deoxychorismate lyase
MDGRVVPASQATVPILDDGFLRGDAVFESVLVRAGRTHALEPHLARMRRSAEAVGIRLPVLNRAVSDLLAAWGEHDGTLKLIVTRGLAVRAILQRLENPASLALHPVEVPWASALSGVKTLSYGPNVWATRQAQRAHADDAVVISDGIVHEVPTAAIAWVRDGRIHAPDPEKLPILDSITLAELMKTTEVVLDVHPLDDLLRADEAFVLSASRCLLPVHAVGDVELAAPGPVTSQARSELLAHIEATVDPRP